MGDHRAGLGHLGHLRVGQMEAMTKNRSGSEEAVVGIDIGVAGAVGEQGFHQRDFVRVFGKMGLEVGPVLLGQLAGAAHKFARTGNGKAGAEGIFKTSAIAAVPLAAERFAFGAGSVGSFLRGKGTVTADIHHDLADDEPQAAFLGGGEGRVRAVCKNRGVEHGAGCAMAGQIFEKGPRLDPRSGGLELFFERKDVLLQPGQQGLGVAGYGRILGQVGMDVDQAGDEHGLGRMQPADVATGLGHANGLITSVSRDAAFFNQQSAVADAPQPVAGGGVNEKSADSDEALVRQHERAGRERGADPGSDFAKRAGES